MSEFLSVTLLGFYLFIKCVLGGKLTLSLYICAKLFADIVCVSYRLQVYIKVYLRYYVVVARIVYSQNAWRRLQFFTAGKTCIELLIKVENTFQI